jgi:hypothetical protein
MLRDVQSRPPLVSACLLHAVLSQRGTNIVGAEYSLLCFHYFSHQSALIYCSNALEELSVRAGIALVQKKVMHDIISEGEIDDEFDREYTALSAQVVSLSHVSERLSFPPYCSLDPR